MVRKYIPCRICGKPVPARTKSIVCSRKCGREWENRISSLQLRNLQSGGGKTATCRKRFLHDGKHADIGCGNQSEEACAKCGWNPEREKELIQKARAEREKPAR